MGTCRNKHVYLNLYRSMYGCMELLCTYTMYMYISMYYVYSTTPFGMQCPPISVSSVNLRYTPKTGGNILIASFIHQRVYLSPERSSLCVCVCVCKLDSTSNDNYLLTNQNGLFLLIYLQSLLYTSPDAQDVEQADIMSM